MLERPRTVERYVRGFAAAVIAVATLLLAADAGPARAAEPEPAHTAHLSNPVKSAGR